MKLYSYSSELHTFIESKWVITKFTITGILMGIAIIFGAIKLNQSIGSVSGYSPTSTLAAENNFLQQQVSLISTRARKLELQVKQLKERADTLHNLLPHRKNIGETVSSFTNVSKEFKLQAMIPMEKSLQH